MTNFLNNFKYNVTEKIQASRNVKHHNHMVRITKKRILGIINDIVIEKKQQTIVDRIKKLGNQ